jgi:hypothetical protein
MVTAEGTHALPTRIPDFHCRDRIDGSRRDVILQCRAVRPDGGFDPDGAQSPILDVDRLSRRGLLALP